MNNRLLVVNSVSFSPDGKTIVSGDNEQQSQLKLWDVNSGELIRSMNVHSSYVRSVSFSPDGKKIVAGSNDGSVTLWNRESGILIQTLTQDCGTVESVCFSPNGEEILAGSWPVSRSRNGKKLEGSFDKTVTLWNVESGTMIRSFKGQSHIPRCVSFSPDGRKIISGSYDGTINLWDTEKGYLIRSMTGHLADLRSVRFSLITKNRFWRYGQHFETLGC
ncbi:MAG: WD40 repeat domain-containing protein [Desulfobacteraceae bacterium]|nr:WD40 repeat domain-containing protein [Desulfobacteraceae bacterium]